MKRMIRILSIIVAISICAAACGSDAESTTTTDDAATVEEGVAEDDDSTSTDETDDAAASTEEDTSAASDATTATESFTIEVWADNWMAVYVDGQLVGEDSVSITTERSFNSETFTFEAGYPFTLAIEAKDYRETDSGLEYIGESNQQMGDGGIIAQVTDSSGAVIAVTAGSWDALVTNRAPLNTDCVSDSDPDATCEFEISEYPTDWTSVDFDSSGWGTATEWSAEAVDPKLGYDDISWDPSAALIWGSDLEIDNTILLRTVVAG